MQTRITLASLSSEQQLCLRTAVRCGGLTVRKVGYVGLNFHDAESIAVYNSTVVGALVRRRLLACASIQCGTVKPTDAGIVVADGGALETDVEVAHA